MRFYAPTILWMLVPVLGLLPFVWHRLEKRAAARFSRFASSAILGSLVRGGDVATISKRRRVRFALGTAALALAIVALARPQMGVRDEVLPSQGLDMVFLLDVSNSMLAEDIVPSRIKKAKHVIKNFVDRLSGDRVGLVAFAGSAYPAVPLTTDYEFVRESLEVLDENSVANQGTNLGKAIMVATELLNRGGVNEVEDQAQVDESDSGASRVIIILSDGEAHEGEEAQLVDGLKRSGTKVFSIGVGSHKGSPIPMRDQGGYMRGYKRDTTGNMVLTKLESAALEAIAGKTGGKYYEASTNEGEVEEILGLLTSMDRSEGGGRRVVVYDEYYQWPLALGLLCLFTMLWLREVSPVRQRNAAREHEVATLIFAFIALGALEARADSSLEEYSSTRQGLRAYEEKDYPAAIQHFGKAQAAKPELSKHHMNLGAAMLRAGSVDGAANEFQAVTKDKDATKAAKGAYNLGKTFEQAKDFEKAIQAYQSGLDRLNQDPKSDSEVELRIKRALEQAQQKQKQQQNQQKNENDGESKDGQGNNNQQSDEQNQNKDKQNQKYQIPRKKPDFKGEKLNEGDAKRIMKQMQEQEKTAKQRVMRNKTGKPKDDKNGKDW